MTLQLFEVHDSDVLTISLFKGGDALESIQWTNGVFENFNRLVGRLLGRSLLKDPAAFESLMAPPRHPSDLEAALSRFRLFADHTLEEFAALLGMCNAANSFDHFRRDYPREEVDRFIHVECPEDQEQRRRREREEVEEREQLAEARSKGLLLAHAEMDRGRDPQHGS